MRSVVFDSYDSYDDWGLILTAKSVPAPAVKTSFVSIPGRDGSLDLTEAVGGVPVYDTRTATFEFFTSEGDHEDRVDTFNAMGTALHGKRVNIVDPDYPDHYLSGRCAVFMSEAKNSYMKIRVTAVCDPWRYAVQAKSFIVGSGSIVLPNEGAKILSPTITVIGSALISYPTLSGTATVSKSSGTYIIDNFKLSPGGGMVTVTPLATGSTVQFDYREGVF